MLHIRIGDAISRVCDDCVIYIPLIKGINCTDVECHCTIYTEYTHLCEVPDSVQQRITLLLNGGRVLNEQVFDTRHDLFNWRDTMPVKYTGIDGFAWIKYCILPCYTIVPKYTKTKLLEYAGRMEGDISNKFFEDYYGVHGRYLLISEISD